MKKGLVMLAGVLMAPVMALGVAGTVNAATTEPAGAGGVKDGLTAAKTDGLSDKGPEDLIKNIINLLLMAIGIVSVIMLIIGGFKYTTSNGDSNQVTSAKNTIMYSVIGLVIAIFAYAIVNFVVSKALG